MMMHATPDTPPTLDQAVRDFASHATQPFRTIDVEKELLSKLRRAPSERWRAVDETLEKSPFLFFDNEHEQYIPRRTFFQGAQFLMTPLPDEIREGILLAGHRFIPFLFRNAHPPHCTLRTGDGAAIGRKTVKRTFPDIRIGFAFFAPSAVLRYLMEDDPEGARALANDHESNPAFSLTVFDMAAFYKRHAVTEGDAILCTVEDWTEGVYTIQPVPAAELAARTTQRKRWVKEMERALDLVFDDHGVLPDVSEQFAQAFFLGDPLLRETPPVHLGGFLSESRVYRLLALPMGTILGRTDMDTDEALMNNLLEDSLREPTGRCESLDAILNDLGLPYSADRIEACMRDALFHGRHDADRAVARALDHRDIDFHDERQAAAYKEDIQERWDAVRTTVDPAREEHVGPLRTRILEIGERATQWMQNCDDAGLSWDAIPRESLGELAHYQNVLASLLSMLNRTESPTDEALCEGQAGLDDLEARLSELFDSHSAQLEEAPLLRLLDEEDEEEDNDDDYALEPAQVYQIKVSLKGVRPPIWRRLQILNHTPLDEVHDILQAAMGWTHSHLHEFTIDGDRYGPDADADPFDFDGPEDEKDMPLSLAANGEGSRFTYTYDFGDGWEHSIQIEKVLPIDEDVSYPRCIKGKRACPPEDCGGPWGYRHLLEALADPAHEDREDLIEWLGDDFDPEAFDLDAINRRLGD